jgi:hypothetical protein
MMPTIYDIEDCLKNWRNNPSNDVWTVRGLEEERLMDKYNTMEGEYQALMEIISKLIEARFKKYEPQVSIYSEIEEWDDDENAPKEPLSGVIGEQTKRGVEEAKPNEYFVVAAATDEDSRSPFLMFLAQGGNKWSDGKWIELGVSSHNWRVSDFGLFGNKGSPDEDGKYDDRVDKEEIEKIKKDTNWWSKEGALGWALKITFSESFHILNWMVWPERFVPLSTE